jgi:hypothetical protein
LLTLVAIPPYVQSGLNKVWNLYPPAEDGQAQLPLTAASSAITVFAAAAATIFISRASERRDARIADSETQGAT